MTTPKKTRPIVVTAIHRSQRRASIISNKFLRVRLVIRLSQISKFCFHSSDCFFKDSSPMLEILKHIETCAGRGEQYGISRFTQPESELDCFLHRPRTMEGSRVCQRRGNFLGCRPDQDDMPATLANERRERVVITTFILSTKQDNDTLGECFERLDCCVHIRRL